MTLRTLNYGSYGIFLIMGHAGFCPSTVWCTPGLNTGHNLAGPKQFISDTRKTPRVQEPLIQEHAFSYRKNATIIQGMFLAGLGVTGLWGLKAQEL